MLNSHTIESEKFSLFLLFLNHLLDGERKYKEPVDKVLLEARALTRGDKNLYSISRDTFSIVSYLSKHDKSFFDHLPEDPEKFEKDTYNHVFSLLRTQRPLSFV